MKWVFLLLALASAAVLVARWLKRDARNSGGSADAATPRHDDGDGGGDGGGD